MHLDFRVEYTLVCGVRIENEKKVEIRIKFIF